MWDAIHKKTNKGYASFDIWDLFKKPHNEEWICCPDCKKLVTPVKFHYKTRNKKKFFVATHFRIKGNFAGGCIHGESDEHKKKKILIASLVENKKIDLKINGSTIPFSCLKIKDVPKLPYRWEQKRYDNRADVLFEFEEWHPILGSGIVFEIRVSESKNNNNGKEFDWCKNGYSLAWLDKEQFEDLSLKENKIRIDNSWAFSFFNFMDETRDTISDLYYDISQKLEKYQDLSRKTCRTCKHGRYDKKNPELIVCFERWESFKKISKHEPMDGCLAHGN